MDRASHRPRANPHPLAIARQNAPLDIRGNVLGVDEALAPETNHGTPPAFELDSLRAVDRAVESVSPPHAAARSSYAESRRRSWQLSIVRTGVDRKHGVYLTPAAREAEALLDLVSRGESTATEIRELVRVPPRIETVLKSYGLRHREDAAWIASALRYRRKVGEAFERLLLEQRRAPDVVCATEAPPSVVTAPPTALSDALPLAAPANVSKTTSD